MSGTKYIGAYRVLKKTIDTVRQAMQSRWTRRILVPLSAVVAVTFGLSSTAFASPVHVVSGDTFSALVSSHCGTSNWQGVALPNRDKNLIYAGETIDITCATATPANVPSAASTPSPVPATQQQTSAGWVNPLPGVHLTACWGDGRNHKGIDMDGYKGQPVHAAAAGTVSNTGWIGSGYGIEVMINHGGVWTHYAHLAGTAVSKGQHVAAGQIIGYVGTTGDVHSRTGDGSHLHFEVATQASIYSSQVNPAPFLRSHGVNIGC